MSIRATCSLRDDLQTCHEVFRITNNRKWAVHACAGGVMNQALLLLQADKQSSPLNVMNKTCSHDSRWHCAGDSSSAFPVTEDDNNCSSCHTSVIPQCNRLALSSFLSSVTITYGASLWLFSSDEFWVCCYLLNFLTYSTCDPPLWLQIQLSISLRGAILWGICTQNNYSTVKMSLFPYNTNSKQWHFWE